MTPPTMPTKRLPHPREDDRQHEVDAELVEVAPRRPGEPAPPREDATPLVEHHGDDEDVGEAVDHGDDREDEEDDGDEEDEPHEAPGEDRREDDRAEHRRREREQHESEAEQPRTEAAERPEPVADARLARPERLDEDELHHAPDVQQEEGERDDGGDDRGDGGQRQRDPGDTPVHDLFDRELGGVAGVLDVRAERRSAEAADEERHDGDTEPGAAVERHQELFRRVEGVTQRLRCVEGHTTGWSREDLTVV
jgi:hypothetical protein